MSYELSMHDSKTANIGKYWGCTRLHEAALYASINGINALLARQDCLHNPYPASSVQLEVRVMGCRTQLP